jgi:hypothetical protein
MKRIKRLRDTYGDDFIQASESEHTGALMLGMNTRLFDCDPLVFYAALKRQGLDLVTPVSNKHWVWMQHHELEQVGLKAEDIIKVTPIERFFGTHVVTEAVRPFLTVKDPSVHVTDDFQLRYHYKSVERELEKHGVVLKNVERAFKRLGMVVTEMAHKSDGMKAWRWK